MYVVPIFKYLVDGENVPHQCSNYCLSSTTSLVIHICPQSLKPKDNILGVYQYKLIKLWNIELHTNEQWRVS